MNLEVGYGLLLLGVCAAFGCGSSGSGTSSGNGTGGSHATTGSAGGSGSGGSTGVALGSSSGGSSTGNGCLDASSFASGFTIADDSFCAVAMYTADEPIPVGVDPSWGSHHGPLVITEEESGGGVTLERWGVQAGSSVLVNQSTEVAAGLPAGTYLGAQANDLPFFSWTAISWTGPAPSTSGTIAAIASGAVAQSYAVNGPYWLAGVSDGQGQGRLLYTGLSPLGAPMMFMNGLYAADACSSPSQGLGAGTGCGASALVSSWGTEPGPVAVDSAGNAFAVLSSPASGMQEARGFLAANVARGQGATPGVSLFTIAGSSGSLAAIAPTATTAGLVVFQPFDASTFAPLDVVEQAYTVGADIAPMGSTKTLLNVPADAASGLSFMTDDSDRLWVGFSGVSGTTYVVLGRVP